MVLQDDGLSVSCDGLSIKFKSQDPLTYHIIFKHTTECLLDLIFTAQDRGFQIGDGKSLFSSDDDESFGFVISRYIPRATVSGHIVLDGNFYSANGHGLMVNALQHKPQAVARWNFVNFHSDNHSIMMYQVIYLLYFS
jgi:hypothetical protein